MTRDGRARAGRPLDNTLPKIFGAVCASAAVLGWGYQRIATDRDRRRLAPRESFVANGDRRVHFKLRPGPANGPTVVLENGYAMSSAGWAWVVERLAGEATVLTYDRAGVGWSDPAVGDDPLQGYLEDLDLVLSASRVRLPAILVGHTIGALFARFYQSRRPAHVSAMVLADGTHPRQIESSATEAEQFRWLQEELRFFPFWASLGVLRLAFEPGPTAELPAPARRELAAWLASTEFWRGVRAEVGLWAGELGQRVASLDDLLPIPLAVVTAGDTARRHPALAELQEEFLKLSDHAHRVVVDGATYRTLVTRRDSAERVAEEILGLPVA